MDLQTSKISLIHWLTELQDQSMIQKLLELRSASQKKDWWDELSDEEKEGINEGIAQADRGELIDHEVVMKKYEKWL